MKKVFVFKNSTPQNKKFLIPRNQGEHDNQWIEISIDNQEKLFIVKKIKISSIGNEWVEYGDYTFPSSLLGEFLNSED